MQVIDPGHFYRLKCLDEPSGNGTALLQFVKREGPGYPGNIGHYPGTTLQEVLRACANRLRYVNAQKPARESEAALGLVTGAIWMLENRAARLHGREPLLNDTVAEFGKCCPQCGHVGCSGSCR